jgi:hypothetical protein
MHHGTLPKSNMLSASWSTLNKDIPPLTPAVTGISYPSPSEVRQDRQRPFILTAPSESSHHHSSSDDSLAPSTPTDIDTLGQLWESIRLDKERRMAKEPSKIKSFTSEGGNPESQRPSLTNPVLNLDPPQILKKKSLYASVPIPISIRVPDLINFSELPFTNRQTAEW